MADFDWFTAGEGPRPRPGDHRLAGPAALAPSPTPAASKFSWEPVQILYAGKAGRTAGGGARARSARNY